MDNFLRYFYQDIGRVFRALLEVFNAFFSFLNYLLNFPMRIEIMRSYEDEFGTMDWVMLLITYILLVLVIVALVIGIGKLFRKIFRLPISGKKYDEMKKQMRALQRDLMRANYEKDKLLAMKLAEASGGGAAPEDLEEDEEEKQEEEESGEEEESEEETALPPSNRNTFQSPCVDPSESRFFRLTKVDNYYKTEYAPPTYEDDITLEEICSQFREFAASQLKLYYELDMMRYFIAAMGTARIIILQGISVPVKPVFLMPLVSSCRRTPPWFPCSPPGVSVRSCTATSMNLPRSIRRRSSSGPSTRPTTTAILILSFSMR